MNIAEAFHPELDELSRDIQPEQVLDTMELHKANHGID